MGVQHQGRERRFAGAYVTGTDGTPVAVLTPPAATTNALAIVSLVTWTIGLSLQAIVFGRIARSQIKRIGQAGAGVALAGLILGHIALAASLVFIAFFFVLAGQLG
ncbi:MAG: DUF4190 domain-containing protein [Bifidobacteriaceae bacterium]|nr:DUF4190 domain-containing protein [Bifidobacteriaceae bacterium]